jgi:hypothetical protein
VGTVADIRIRHDRREWTAVQCNRNGAVAPWQAENETSGGRGGTMANGDGKSGPTWKWIVGILMVMFSFSAAMWVNRIEAQLEKKADKELVLDMKCKIDKIYEWHIPAELRGNK